MGAQKSKIKNKSGAPSTQQTQTTDTKPKPKFIHIQPPNNDPSLPENHSDPFFILPKDVVVDILLYLDRKSLGRVAQVSRRWHACALSPQLWDTFDILVTKPWEVNDSRVLGLAHQQFRGISLNFSDEFLSGKTEPIGISHTYLLALRHVVKLDLSFCKKITNDGIEQLATISTLKQLNLSWLRRITLEPLKKICKKNVHIEFLSLHGCVGTSNGMNELDEVVKYLPKIHSLDVGSVHLLNHPADKAKHACGGLVAIAKYCKQLNYLNVDDWGTVPEEILLQLLEECTQLQTLIISKTFLTEKVMNSLVSLKRLKHLDISALPRSCELYVLLEQLSLHPDLSSQLEVLNISKNAMEYSYANPNLQPTPVNRHYTKELVNFLQNATKLKVLMMNECYGMINDDVFRAIATNCPNLEKLGVVGSSSKAEVIKITGREDIQVDS